ncbi:acyl-CoA thioesterase [Desulfurispirillum indicum]|uniref:Thioesterase superfamily protein n=1 Tax=Desulfurispirillum indicum (strain ATCC BAA-1389 / DSM 22839 / S5) TaxID=653733 RepID=E6W4G6_DESIS|nr:acyl-CoA thioesterase [Desulfurispirillum indicum]ADU65940.1 thioesterase superfamily protein [Desulfurispirillum indicum S5]UCZ57874.1 acyl-CoA thioesterase [Desulfurispirillum indicum]
MECKAESIDFIFPEDLNHHGTLFGGKITKQMAKTAAIVATRYAHSKILLVSINNFTFLAPVNLGDTFRIEARVIGTGRTSIEIRAEGFTQNPLEGEESRACFAYFTFVKLAEDNTPLPVDPFRSENDYTREMEMVRTIKEMSRNLRDIVQ